LFQKYIGNSTILNHGLNENAIINDAYANNSVVLENKKFGKDLLLINIPIAKIKMLSIMPSLEEAPE